MVYGRLRRRAEFRRVYASGVKVPGRFMVLFALADPEGPRLGITTTRRVGTAVARNRARRRIRELAKRHWRRLAVLGADLVVNVRRSCVEATWAELEKDFSSLLGRVERALCRDVSSASC